MATLQSNVDFDYKLTHELNKPIFNFSLHLLLKKIRKAESM